MQIAHSMRAHSAAGDVDWKTGAGQLFAGALGPSKTLDGRGMGAEAASPFRSTYASWLAAGIDVRVPDAGVVAAAALGWLGLHNWVPEGAAPPLRLSLTPK